MVHRIYYGSLASLFGAGPCEITPLSAAPSRCNIAHSEARWSYMQITSILAIHLRAPTHVCIHVCRLSKLILILINSHSLEISEDFHASGMVGWDGIQKMEYLLYEQSIP